MSILDCLAKAMAKSEVSPVFKGTVEKLRKEMEHMKALAGETGQDVLSEYKLAEQIYNNYSKRLDQKVRQTTIHASLVEQGLSRFKEGVDPTDAVRSLLTTSEKDIFKHGGFGPSAAEMIRSNQRIFTGLATDVLDNLDPKKLAYLKDPARVLDIKRDIYAASLGKGQRSSDAVVTSITDKIMELTSKGSEAYERAGGSHHGKFSTVLGRAHSLDKVAKAGRDDYIKDGLKYFDLAAIKEATGGYVDSPQKLAQLLLDDYESIVSGGIRDLSDNAPTGLKDVIASRNGKRIFHFTDAEADLAWHTKYGEDNLYSRVVSYAQGIGSDIGILQTLGPKPSALIKTMMRKAAEIDPAKALASRTTVSNEFMYVTGRWDRSLRPDVSKWMSTHAASQVANKLGFTAIDAVVGDMIGLNIAAGRMRGIPALHSILEDIKTLLTPGVRNSYKALADMGLHAEAFIDDSHALLDSMNAEGAHKFFSSAARGVMKWTGNTRATNVGRTVKVKQLANMLAEMTDMDDNPQLANWLKGIGLTPDTLKLAQQFGIEKHATFGIPMISPTKLFNAGYEKEAAEIGMVFGRAVEIFSPMSSDRFKASVGALERTGFLPQIFVGSAKGFTGYASSFWNNHVSAILHSPGAINKAKMFTSFATVMWMAGIAQTLIRDSLMGKDPELNQNTLMRGAMRSGMLSIVGDLIFNSSSVSGGQAASRLTGTLVGSGEYAAAAVNSAIQGDKVKTLTNAQKLMEQFLPGKNAWYASAAIERLMSEQLKYLYDPEAAKKFKRKASRSANAGQAYWWVPGQALPSRAPNLDLTDKPFSKPKRKKRTSSK